MAEIKIAVFPRAVKNGKTKFTAYKTKVNLDCYAWDKEKKEYTDEHEVKTIYVDLKFTNAVNTKELKRGYIIIDSKNVEVPLNNKTWVNDDGKTIYPSVWIKGDYKKFVEVVKEPKQSAFASIEDDTDEIEIESAE